jgi:hypothetical protein
MVIDRDKKRERQRRYYEKNREKILAGERDDAPMGGTDLKRIDLLEAPAPYEPDEEEDIMMLRGGYSRW